MIQPTMDELLAKAARNEELAAVDNLNRAYANLDVARDGGTEEEIAQAHAYLDANLEHVKWLFEARLAAQRRAS